MSKSKLTYQILLDESGVASEELAPYTGVVINPTTRAVSYPAAAGDRIDGIVIDGCNAGEQIRVVTDGVVPVKIATASSVVNGAMLFANTSGQFVATATVGHEASAISEDAAANNGDIILARVSKLITYVEPSS